jgi:uncharacterized protein YggL (DUF469 family)
LSLRFRDEITEAELIRFWDAFILGTIERNGLVFGGGSDGFVCASRRGSANESHREIMRIWLANRPDVMSSRVGPLVDAWYQPEIAEP